MVVAKIDRDYISEDLTTPSRVGLKITHEHANKSWPKVRFRCKDDDGEVYYGGWLLNDSEGEVQLAMLRWTQHDAGCTTIEVSLNNEWIQEIG